MVDKVNDRDASHAMFGLNDSETRRSAPTEAAPVNPPAPSGTPQYIYVQAPPPASPPSAGTGIKVLPMLVGLLLAISAINLYLVISARRQFTDSLAKQSDELDLLTRRLDSGDERYAQLSGKFQVTTEKLGLTQQELARARSLASGVQKQQEEAVKQLNDAISKKASAEELNKLQADSNSKIGGLSTDLAGTKKELEDTKSAFTDALAGTKGELGGAIARTHDELVALAHKTDRDYFEFNLKRKGARQKIGTLMIELTKTNPKKNQFTLNLFFDDKRTERRDKSINEPLYFYVQGASSALELVVNKLGKDSITGYVSTPKGFFPNTANVLGSRPGA